jgi:hypothetical protein
MHFSSSIYNACFGTRATERELPRSIGHHRSRQPERRTYSTVTDADISTFRANLGSKLSAALPSFSGMAGTGFADTSRENQADQLATQSHASAPPKRSGRKVFRHDSLDARRRGQSSKRSHGANVAGCAGSRRSSPSSRGWSAWRSPLLSPGIGLHLGRSPAPAERVPPDGLGHHCRRPPRRTR